jgi:Uma2 family endonuclease
MSTLPAQPTVIHYPESDGKSMAESTLQFDWIVTLHTNLDRLFADRADVFVGGNNFWYPVEGSVRICQAPDVYVVFGRPKGHRGSYRQWEEGGIAPQVVIEVLSPGNRLTEMERKRRFYRRYGVREYIILDPDRCTLEVHEWDGPKPRRRFHTDYTSRLLGVRFVARRDFDIRAFYPDGRPFLTAAELAAARDQAETRATNAEARNAALADKLRSLGIDPDTV